MDHDIIGLYRGVAIGRPGEGAPLAPRNLVPRNLADQLTLFKPVGGGQTMPVTLLPAPLDSKFYLHLCYITFTCTSLSGLEYYKDYYINGQKTQFCQCSLGGGKIVMLILSFIIYHENCFI